jgi:hypothetical protein
MRPILATSGFALALMAGLATASAADSTANAANSSKDADAMKSADQLHHTNLRQELQDQLTKAGYSQVTIMPSSFYVRAKDKKGEPVAMVIGPDSFSEVTDLTTSGRAAAEDTSKTPDMSKTQDNSKTNAQQK